MENEENGSPVCTYQEFITEKTTELNIERNSTER